METADDVKRFVDIYVARINNKTDLAIHYWKKYKFDFFMPNFTEAHCAGHRCWHIHDSSHPDHDPELAAAVGDPVKDIYVAMDRAVGRLVEAAEQDARVLVYLSHGMGPGYSGTRLLDRILSRLESSEPRTLEGPLLSPVRKCWRQMPDFIRRSLYPLRNKISNDGFQPNRETRRFFEVFANDRTGGIRLNLIGREAKGTVHPEDFDAVCAELIEDLREVVNAETGEPIAEEILRVRDLYDGQFIDYLPDILITWKRSKPINAAKSPKIGVIDKTGLFFVRTGDHLPIGHFYALAKDIPPGIMNTSVRAEDFAPTIARIFNVQDIHTDGKAIARLLPSYELQANS
jgi:predicted AlkP superfamily phosphohydrolase/phosphomutase